MGLHAGFTNQKANTMSNFTFTFPALEGSLNAPAPVRIVTKGGEPWFVAKDVADVLGYRDAEKMTRNLDDDETDTQIVGIRSANGVHQNREVAVINESGLYTAILKSRRKEAMRFKKWVTHEVLPSIRKHGGYSVGQEALPEELVASLHRTIKENALPALRYYDRLTEHDHWKSPRRRQELVEQAIAAAALKFDLPVSLMRRLSNQGQAALSPAN